MQFNQIQYFLVSCDTLNFTRAAELCNVSQPALTVAIGKLEEELGNKLFNRENRRLELSEFGGVMRVEFQRIKAARDAATSTASKYNKHKPAVVNIGIMCTLSPQLLLKAIGDWQVNIQDAELLLHDVSEHRVQELLLSNVIDCALVAHSMPLPERFNTVSFFTEPMVLAMGQNHPLNNKTTIELNDIANEPYIDRLRCEFRSVFFSEMANLDISIKTIISSEREDWVAKAVAHGIGVSIMPKHAAIGAGLQAREIENLSIIRSIDLVSVAAKSQSMAATQFIEFVSRVASDPTH